MPSKRGTMPSEGNEAEPKQEEVEEVPELEPEPTPPEPAEIEEEAVEEEEEGIALETMDPEELLWPGGPKVGQVLEWKEQYGEVWVTTLNPYTDKHVIWRPLNRPEYRRLVAHLENALSNGTSQALASMDNEEAITELVSLYPPYDRKDTKSPAGLPQTIAQEVMEISGFAAVEVRQL